MKTTVLAIALIGAAGIAQAQTGTSTPTTPLPGSPTPPVTAPATMPPSATSTPVPSALNPPTTTANEAAVRSKLEAAGFSGVKGLTMAPNGTWRGVGTVNNVEVAVSMDSGGRIMTQ